MAELDATISAASPLTEYISGTDLSNAGSRQYDRRVTAQFVPSAVGDWNVELEAKVNAIKAPAFASIGSFDQDDEALVVNFPISEGALYRFKHVSGLAVRVLLTG